MKLIAGRKYTVMLPTYTYKNLYYVGKCDCLGGQQCDICGKELETGFLFMSPSGNTVSYEQCIDGSFAFSVVIGRACKKKVKVIEVEQ